jgi:hypothetical protein
MRSIPNTYEQICISWKTVRKIRVYANIPASGHIRDDSLEEHGRQVPGKMIRVFADRAAKAKAAERLQGELR